MLNRYNQPNLVEGYIKMKKAAFTAFSQSGRRDSNPRPRPWQGRALPTELLPHFLLFINAFVNCDANIEHLKTNDQTF